MSGRISAAVQGFGKVGRDAVRFLHEQGITVIAVSDEFGAIYSDKGIDTSALDVYYERVGSIVGFDGAEPLPDRDDLLFVEVDLLVPCAIEGVITADNASRIAARVVVVGANGPITPAADEALEGNGVQVVPDILANAGGVVVSYFEWVQANQAYWWSPEQVESRLRERMEVAWQRVSDQAQRLGVPLRKAASTLAVSTVAAAHMERGLYP